MKNPRYILPFFFIFGSLVLLAGCGGNGSGEAASPEGESRPIRIAVIPKGTTHAFWQSIHAGAIKAEREVNEAGGNLRITWQGPLLENDRTQQIDLVETFTTRRVDGIVLAPLDSRALVAPVNAAHRAGIPVAIIDSGIETENIISFIASDNFRGGQLAARRLGELLGGEGNILMLRYQVGSASTEEREAGFMETLIEEFPDIVVVSDNQYAGPNRETALTAATNLLNRHGRDLDGVFTSNESATAGMLLALRRYTEAGRPIRFVGFDAADELLTGLRDDELHGLIVQNPFNMGYLGVMSMVRHLRGETLEPNIDTGVTLITRENVDSEEMQTLLFPPLREYLD